MPKGKLVKIDWGDKEQQIKEIWEASPRLYSSKSSITRITRIKKLFDYDGSNLVGYCSKCRELNSYIQYEDRDGALLITRFCDQHVPQ